MSLTTLSLLLLFASIAYTNGLLIRTFYVLASISPIALALGIATPQGSYNVKVRDVIKGTKLTKSMQPYRSECSKQKSGERRHEEKQRKKEKPRSIRSREGGPKTYSTRHLSNHHRPNQHSQPTNDPTHNPPHTNPHTPPRPRPRPKRSRPRRIRACPR
jgi:hypothetical protein